MVNIFEQGKALTVSWFYFKEIGDEIQGTYIGKKTGVKDSFGNDQVVYVLETEAGIKNVGFKVTQRINKDMEFVKVGQIIGFKYLSREKGINKVTKKPMEFKNIVVFADPKIVDQPWLDAHDGGKSLDIDVLNAEATPPEDEGSSEESTSGFGDFDSPVPTENPATHPVSEGEVLKQIIELAKTKLGVVDPTQTKDKVMEATGLAFLPVNFSKILDVLKSI